MDAHFARCMGPLRSSYAFPGVGRILESLGTWWVTESYFAWPSQASRRQVEDDAGDSATSYEFKWHADGNEMQANHSIDIPIMLGRPGAWRGAPMLVGLNSTEQQKKLGPHMRNLYAGFIQGHHFKLSYLVTDQDFECSDSLWQGYACVS